MMPQQKNKKFRVTGNDHVIAPCLNAVEIGYTLIGYKLRLTGNCSQFRCGDFYEVDSMRGIIQYVRDAWANRIVPTFSSRMVDSNLARHCVHSRRGGLLGKEFYQVAAKVGLTLAAILAASPLYARDYPAVNLPPSYRQANWGEDGSCGHATTVTLLNQQAFFATARDWRRTHNGPTNIGLVAAELESRGIRCAVVVGQTSASFLEWSIATRRGCYVSYPAAELIHGADHGHSLALVDLDEDYATVIDNNDTARFYRIARDEFLANWYAFGGSALALLHSPLPPL